MRKTLLFMSILLGICSTTLAQDLSTSLVQINKIRRGGAGHEAAAKAWDVVGQQGIDKTSEILRAIDFDNPLAANWLRSAAEQIVEKHAASGKELPLDAFEEIVFDKEYDPRARRMAYEWLLQSDPTAKSRIIPKMLNDSSLEMRRDAVAMAIGKAELLDGDAAKKQYLVALSSARDLDQVEAITKILEDAGEEIDLQKHFGFLANWKLIGPFDNTDKSGYDVAYGPESDLLSEDGYQGKKGRVEWKTHSTKDNMGAVDLNEELGKNMGAAAYAYTEFESGEGRPVDLRLVSKNANKIWLNGELVMKNEVYHSGSGFDQYIEKAEMRPGKNTILVKICQNEQTDAWAQDWQFQLRVCDELGTAISSAK